MVCGLWTLACAVGDAFYGNALRIQILTIFHRICENVLRESMLIACQPVTRKAHQLSSAQGGPLVRHTVAGTGASSSPLILPLFGMLSRLRMSPI